jgi:hypothetical protein
MAWKMLELISHSHFAMPIFQRWIGGRVFLVLPVMVFVEPTLEKQDQQPIAGD